MYSKAKADLIVGATKAGADATLAASVAGVSRRTLFYWLKLKPKLKERMDEARDFADAQVIRSLYERARGAPVYNPAGQVVGYQKGETLASIWWLKNRRPDEWRDRHELTGGDKPLRIIVEDRTANGDTSGSPPAADLPPGLAHLHPGE